MAVIATPLRVLALLPPVTPVTPVILSLLSLKLPPNRVLIVLPGGAAMSSLTDVSVAVAAITRGASLDAEITKLALRVALE